MTTPSSISPKALATSAALGAMMIPTIASATLLVETVDFSNEPLAPDLLPQGTTIVEGSHTGSFDAYDRFQFVGLTPGTMLDLYLAVAWRTEFYVNGFAQASSGAFPNSISVGSGDLFPDAPQPRLTAAARQVTVGAQGLVDVDIYLNFAAGTDYCVSIVGACTPASLQPGGVPAPGTLLLGGAGLLAAGAARRRRRHAR